MSDILDQSDIDKLLAAATEPPKTPLLRANGRHEDLTEASKVEPYDFRTPVFLTEVELRRLRLLHEDFIRYLSARLSLFLRMEFGLKMAKLTTLTYSKFTDSLPNPSHLCLFKAEPLAGVGVLDINPRLALTLVDRLLGGRGHSVKTERYLTEIEIALLEDIIRLILEEWCGQWRHEDELHPKIIGHENNGRFLQTAPKDEIVLALSLEASFGDCAEQIQIGVPYAMIEPLVRALHAKRAKDGATDRAPRGARPKWLPIYEHISLTATVDWPAFELTLGQVSRLQPGQILRLPEGIADRTILSLAGAPKFVGQAGVEQGRVCMKLSRKFSPEEHSDE
jgi:flagellar motor switch protein FliM